MNPSEREKWVVIAEFMAFDMGFAADIAVSKLQANGIPARRFPTGVITGAIGMGVPTVEPIRVVVPPNQAERAREILDHSERGSDQ